MLNQGDWQLSKVLLFLIVALLCSYNSLFQYCFADELRLDSDTIYQKQVMQTGFKILNANNLQDNRMTFYYVSDNKTKIKSNNRFKRIYVYKGMFPYIDDENELAALIAPEIGHIMDMQAGFFRRFSVSFSPRKYEVRADKKAVDLLVKAGYDPVALINIINKTAKEENWFEYNVFRHNGTERTQKIYGYIYEKYPIFLADNKYLTSPYYQNFLRTTQKERKQVRSIQEERLHINNTKDSQNK